MMNGKRYIKICASVLATLVLCGIASADPIQVSVTLSPATLNSQAGSSVAFFGVITNLSDVDVFLNQLELNSGSGLTVDGFADLPMTLAAGASFTGSLFSVATDFGLLDGTSINGNISFLGGAEGGSFDALGNVDLTVNVVAAGDPGTPVPEPSTLTLLGIGCAGVSTVMRRRRWREAMQQAPSARRHK
jgi:hypothetical protein